MTYVFDDNIIIINYIYFAYSYRKINDYLICLKIYLLGVVKELTDIRYGINGLRSGCAKTYVRLSRTGRNTVRTCK